MDIGGNPQGDQGDEDPAEQCAPLQQSTFWSEYGERFVEEQYEGKHTNPKAEKVQETIHAGSLSARCRIERVLQAVRNSRVAGYEVGPSLLG